MREGMAGTAFSPMLPSAFAASHLTFASLSLSDFINFVILSCERMKAEHKKNKDTMTIIFFIENTSRNNALLFGTKKLAPPELRK
jgi:hypothetical protein